MSTVDQTSATDTLVERFGLKALVESCLVLEEGIASAKDIEIGMMMGAGILPGTVRARRRAGPRRRARGARARAGGVGRRVRAAADPAPPGRAGPARPEERPGLLPLPAGRGRRHREARGPRRRRDRLAQPAAREPALARARPEADRDVGDRPRASSAPSSSRRRTSSRSARARTSRRSRRWIPARRGASSSSRRTGSCAGWSSRARSRSRRSTRSRSAAAASSRWPATSGSPPSRPPSASPRSTSGSSPASAARSGCRGSWARPRRSR